MACFTRSVVWRFWTAVLLLSDMLLHLVHAGTLEENSDYQACVASPSTCGILCALSLEGGLELATTPYKRSRGDGANWGWRLTCWLKHIGVDVVMGGGVG